MNPSRRPAAARRIDPAPAAERWVLRLYVAGQTPKPLTALANLKRLCDERLKNRYGIEVIDRVLNPGLAEGRPDVRHPDAGAQATGA